MNKENKCTECNKIFPFQGKKSVCSPECYTERQKRYYRDKNPLQDRICKWCNKPFQYLLPGKKQHCSPTCTLESHVWHGEQWRMKNVKCKRIPGTTKKKQKNNQKQVRGKKMHIQQLEFPEFIRA